MNSINNLRGGHYFGSSRTRRITGRRITTFKLGHPVFTVAYDGACSPNFLSEWREFPSAQCLFFGRGGLDDSSRLHVAAIARVA